MSFVGVSRGTIASSSSRPKISSIERLGTADHRRSVSPPAQNGRLFGRQERRCEHILGRRWWRRNTTPAGLSAAVRAATIILRYWVERLSWSDHGLRSWSANETRTLSRKPAVKQRRDHWARRGKPPHQLSSLELTEILMKGTQPSEGTIASAVAGKGPVVLSPERFILWRGAGFRRQSSCDGSVTSIWAAHRGRLHAVRGSLLRGAG